MGTMKSIPIGTSTVDPMVAVVTLVNAVVAFAGVDAARDALIDRGFSSTAASRVLEIAPTIARLVGDDAME